MRHPVRDFSADHNVVDGDLVTGQNQNAGPMVARLMMQRALEKRERPGPASERRFRLGPSRGPRHPLESE